MDERSLQVVAGHLFVSIDGDPWLVDTGSPSSFGKAGAITVGGRAFHIAAESWGMTVDSLCAYVHTPCVGLLGADVLNTLDVVFDVAAGTARFSHEPLSCHGEQIALTFFNDLPMAAVHVGQYDYRMFFDTGAHLSYFQCETLASYPHAGVERDFYPQYGHFETVTHTVPVRIGAAVEQVMRFGQLPETLAAGLVMADADGIVGNELLLHRRVGYFPRRGLLVVGGVRAGGSE